MHRRKKIDHSASERQSNCGDNSSSVQIDHSVTASKASMEVVAAAAAMLRTHDDLERWLFSTLSENQPKLPQVERKVYEDVLLYYKLLGKQTKIGRERRKAHSRYAAANRKTQQNRSRKTERCHFLVFQGQCGFRRASVHYDGCCY